MTMILLTASIQDIDINLFLWHEVSFTETGVCEIGVDRCALVHGLLVATNNLSRVVT